MHTHTRESAARAELYICIICKTGQKKKKKKTIERDGETRRTHTHTQANVCQGVESWWRAGRGGKSKKRYVRATAYSTAAVVL